MSAKEETLAGDLRAAAAPDRVRLVETSPQVRAAGGSPGSVAAPRSGFEGREEMLGKAVGLAIRTLKDSMPYQHEMNDALVKIHLNALQFAKNKGMIRQFVEHDVQTMQPTLRRIKTIMEQTGDKETALIGIFDQTACFYQLCLDMQSSPGARTFTFPFSNVLNVARKIGQFDMTDAEVHEIWLKARLRAYAKVLGVEFDISDIGPDNKVTVKLVA